MATNKEKANQARLKVLEMIYKGQSSHIGSNFSIIDVLTVLFDKVDLKKDKIVFSKGWVAASAYYFLSKKGLVTEKELKTYCQEGSKFIGLVEPNVAGIEAAGGSMGYGLPFGVGFALAKKLKREEGKVYVVMSDGEMQIGTTWESILIAAQHKLDNLVVVVDKNKLQAMGTTKEVLNIDPLPPKWTAFDWLTMNIDGHDFGDIENALEIMPHKPMVIIANTIKGKGVKFMENDNLYHYKNLTKAEYTNAKKLLCSY